MLYSVLNNLKYPDSLTEHSAFMFKGWYILEDLEPTNLWRWRRCVPTELSK